MGKFYNWMILVVLLAITGSCQREELPETQAIAPEKGLRYERISTETINRMNPEVLLLLETALSSMQQRDLLQSGKKETLLGYDREHITYVEKPSGYRSYTIALLSEPESNLLQNLIISIFPDGSQNLYLANYTLSRPVAQVPESEWENAILKKEFHEIPTSEGMQNRMGSEVCITYWHFKMVEKCEGELTTPGEMPHCYTADGSPAMIQIMVIDLTICGDQDSPAPGGGSGHPGSGDSPGGGIIVSPGSGGGSGSGSGNGNGNLPGGGVIIEPGISDGTTQEPITTIPTLPNTIVDRFLRSLTAAQMSWWQSAPQSIRSSFEAFINSPDYNAGFTREAIAAVMEGGDVDFTYKVIIDKSFKDNECLMGVFTQLGGAPTFQNYLRNFDSDFSVAHLKLSADSDFSTKYAAYNSSGAITFGTYNYVIEIIMNIDPTLISSLNNHPKIYTALALIHELIHAEMYRKLSSIEGLAYFNPNNYTPEQYNVFLENLKPNFPGLFDYYNRFKASSSNLSTAQHQQMAQHYRTIIKETLKHYDNNEHDDSFYEALSWTGLEGTVAWNNLSPEEQNTITLKQTHIIDHESYCND